MIKKDIVFLQCGIPTQNGRIYPEDEVRKALKGFQVAIGANAAYGCRFDQVLGVVVPARAVSHHVTRAELQGSLLVGDIETMPTPEGMMLASIIDHPDTQFGPCSTGRIEPSTGLIDNLQIHSINYFVESAADKAKQAKQTANHRYNKAMGIVKK